MKSSFCAFRAAVFVRLVLAAAEVDDMMGIAFMFDFLTEVQTNPGRF